LKKRAGQANGSEVPATLEPLMATDGNNLEGKGSAFVLRMTQIRECARKHHGPTQKTTTLPRKRMYTNKQHNKHTTHHNTTQQHNTPHLYTPHHITNQYTSHNTAQQHTTQHQTTNHNTTQQHNNTPSHKTTQLNPTPHTTT
jgi:hypothetical protein